MGLVEEGLLVVMMVVVLSALATALATVVGLILVPALGKMVVELVVELVVGWPGVETRWPQTGPKHCQEDHTCSAGFVMAHGTWQSEDVPVNGPATASLHPQQTHTRAVLHCQQPWGCFFRGAEAETH